MSNATIIVIGNNPTRNAEIQKMLFKYGYKWMSGGDGEAEYVYVTAILVMHDSMYLTFFDPNSDWEFTATIIRRVVSERFVTESFIAALPSSVQPAPPIPVHELTMEELNDLSVRNFGYEIKIKK